MVSEYLYIEKVDKINPLFLLFLSRAFLGTANRFTARLEQDATVIACLESGTNYAELCQVSSGLFWLSEFGARGGMMS